MRAKADIAALVDLAISGDRGDQDQSDVHYMGVHLQLDDLEAIIQDQRGRILDLQSDDWTEERQETTVLRSS